MLQGLQGYRIKGTHTQMVKTAGFSLDGNLLKQRNARSSEMRNEITNEMLADVIHSMFKAGMVITDEYNQSLSDDRDISWVMHCLGREMPVEKPVDDLYEQFAEEWIGKKMREKVNEHIRKYPNFKYASEYLRDVLDLPAKTQGWEAYQPIAKWSKSRGRLRAAT